MAESTTIDPGAIARVQTEEALETLLREGARRLLQEALELEVQEYIDRFQQRKDDKGHRLVVRNGHLPPRDLVTGQGRFPYVSLGSTTGVQRPASPQPSCRRICAERPASTR